MNLKKLITAKNAGFRTKTVTVPEWGGISVVLREPSVGAWSAWAETLRSLDVFEAEDKSLQRVAAEAKLFASTLCDDKGNLIFEDEVDDLITNYGPVHSRLLNQALELSGIGQTPIEDAKKK
ncbi:phage tail assembly chaperone [Zophobihabitans entericus]|uniref:Phage tail protein n=1 Tax=Zophobihabitans entericus TaxID=1635327 RepID=A0A6G9IBR1_9GAMM|nr:phage tail assembly chaperone [Zophobihabitans entericus]QIQ21020.1 phage tail protein [Zophobihabitans entericus]